MVFFIAISRTKQSKRPIFGTYLYPNLLLEEILRRNLEILWGRLTNSNLEIFWGRLPNPNLELLWGRLPKSWSYVALQHCFEMKNYKSLDFKVIFKIFEQKFKQINTTFPSCSKLKINSIGFSKNNTRHHVFALKPGAAPACLYLFFYFFLLTFPRRQGTQGTHDEANGNYLLWVSVFLQGNCCNV